MTERLRGQRGLWVAFAAGQLGCLVYPLVASEDLLGSIWYLAVSGLGTAMAAMAAIRHGGRSRHVWAAMSLGLLLFFLGDVIWTLDEFVWNIDPFPSVADVFYVAGYPVLS